MSIEVPVHDYAARSPADDLPGVDDDGAIGLITRGDGLPPHSLGFIDEILMQTTVCGAILCLGAMDTEALAEKQGSSTDGRFPTIQDRHPDLPHLTRPLRHRRDDRSFASQPRGVRGEKVVVPQVADEAAAGHPVGVLGREPEHRGNDNLGLLQASS